jgi:cell wall-associated NlpC family hydrolase
MMTKEQQARLLAAMDEWLGTPFEPWQCVRGHGVDCVQLAGALMVAAGVLDEQPDFGSYTLDLAGHTGREMIVEWLEDSPQFRRFIYDYPNVGDIVTFRIGNAVNHVGVMVSRRDFVHSIQGRAVRVSTLADSTWDSRVAGFWRAI